MNDMEKSIRIAYKKLKSSVYFDKTQLPLRDRIVEFESSDIERKLDRLAGALSSDDEAEWERYEDVILDSVDVLVFPKMRETPDRNLTVFGGDSAPMQFREVRHYIDLSVEGHILGSLWCMAVKVSLENYCSTSGGGCGGYAPNIFEPYYSQYESWRNNAIESARKQLAEKQDALILTFDFQYFFNSLDIQPRDFDAFFHESERYDPWQARLNAFVFDVICRYSGRLRQAVPSEKAELKDRNVLPFGFLPSYILSRLALKRLDEIVTKRRHPLFYGRFNGNIMVVDEVRDDSPLHKKCAEAGEGGFSASDAVEYYFGKFGGGRSASSAPLLLSRKDGSYSVNSALIDCHSSDISVRDKSINLFYFRDGATNSLWSCFRTKFVQTDLDLNDLPLLDDVFIKNDYSELYSIVDSGSQYAPRRVTDATLDKTHLYDFLDKYRRISSMIQADNETDFEKELLRVFTKAELIGNDFIWERLFEILIINGRTDRLVELAEKIVDAIACLDIPEDTASRVFVHDSLMEVFHASLCRATAIQYGEDMSRAIGLICDHITRTRRLKCSPGVIDKFSPAEMLHCRFGYCTSRMVNKYLLPLPIDCILENLIKADGKLLRLFRLDDVMPLLDIKWQNKNIYHYYPYIVTPHELSFAMACTNICSGRGFSDPKLDREELNCLYSDYNYPTFAGIVYADDSLQNVNVERMPDGSDCPCFATSVDSDRRDVLRVAIGNARLSDSDENAALSGGPNRSYERYNKLSQLMDSAIDSGVDLLVLPECYLPFDWVPTVSRLCASRQMALVTGVEHVTHREDGGGRTYNLTAVILPYKEGNHNFSYVTYHSKVQFSPDENLRIKNFGLTPAPGDIYQLFRWHDIWFSVYCCFELASINERALFRSYADITIAVEWNRDVTYFNSIIESLSRDLHCYCIQANSSDYGDSCVIKPAGVTTRDLIKSKGGNNQSILVGDLDIKALRQFQLQEYADQLRDKTFKPTPPLFNTETVAMKIKGSLWDSLE